MNQKDLGNQLLNEMHAALGTPSGLDWAGWLEPYYSMQEGVVRLKRESGRLFTPETAHQAQLGLRLTAVRPLSQESFGMFQPTTGLGTRLTVVLLVHDPALTVDRPALIRAVGRVYGVRFLALDNDPLRTLVQVAQVDPEALSAYPVQLRALSMELEYAEHQSF